MSVELTLTAGTLPQGFCPTTEQARLNGYAAALSIILPDYYGQFVISSSTPAAEDQDKVWLKLDGSGNPIGFFLYVGGAWTQISAPNVWVGDCAGSANAYTLTVSNYPSSTGPRTNDVFIVSIPAANTGASTLNLNSTGNKDIKSAGAALWDGALEADKWYTLVYDGTNYEVSAIKELTVSEITPGTDKQFLRTGTGPVSQWESAYYGTGQAIPAAGSSVTFTHGLGSTPLFTNVRLKCTTTDLNYAVGSEVDIPPLYDAENNNDHPAFAVYCNSTSIVVVRNSIATDIQLINATTGSDSGTITEGSWQLVAYAIR